MTLPGGSPTTGGGGPEALFGQILQTMQTELMQMAQDSQQRFELLERGLQEQVRDLQASTQAQVSALASIAKKANVVDIKGVGKPTRTQRKPGKAGHTSLKVGLGYSTQTWARRS